MKAMILAAGRGERMMPLTKDLPKPLLRAGGRCLIEYHLMALKKAGFDDIVINHAKHGKKIEQTLGDGSRYGVRIAYSAEGNTPLETAGGIFRALPLLGEQAFLVVNGDVYTHFPFERLRHAPDGLAHLVLIDNPPHHTQGDFALHDGRVNRDGENKHTFSGIGLYKPALFDGCKPGSFPLAPLLIKAMDAGRCSGEFFQGEWRDIGTPERLQRLDQELLGKRAEAGKVT